MTINELEKLVNENRLCCYEALTSVDETDCYEQPFELWEKQGYFRELRKAEENLKRCGYSLVVYWQEDCHCIEYNIYKEVNGERKFVTLLSGDVFSWYNVQCLAKMACSALNIEYNY